MQRSCCQCAVPFDVTNDDLAFLEKVSPVFHGKKEVIPPPTLCPLCRLQRRLTFRNHNYVYRRPSSTTGEMLFSMWTADVPFPVVKNEEWWGDGWDALAYGREYDFARPFFPQFMELRNSVPHFALDVLNMENSSYCNNTSNLRNCYMVFNTNNAEDCLYCEHVWNSKDCIDCTSVVSSELCYNCVQCTGCYALQDAQFCDDCAESFFLTLCRACQHCFGCSNLRHKEYCIFNEQKTKEEYERFLGSLSPSSFQEREQWREKARALARVSPRPHVTWRRTENVSGNFLAECKNVHESFFIRDGEDLRYCLNISEGIKDCRDLSLFGVHAELLYESAVCGLNAHSLHFCYSCWDNVDDLLYCWQCVGGSHCFGCVGLRKKQYCILNTQYTREEYEERIPRIIAHMQKTKEYGEFFPWNISVMPYNHTLAQRYFPLSKGDAQQRGLLWCVREEREDSAALPAANLPDALPPTDAHLRIRSTLSGKAFKITPQEIKRYRAFRVPLPRLTYDERIDARARELGGITLYDRTCTKTGKPIKTTYPPDSPFTIWDRDVYEQELGG